MTGKKYSIVSQMVNLKIIYTWYKMLTRWWNTLYTMIDIVSVYRGYCFNPIRYLDL